MSGGIFYLDEERDRDRKSPSPSPHGSPPLGPVANNDTFPLASMQTTRQTPSSTSTSALLVPNNGPSLQIPTTATTTTIFSPSPTIAKRHPANFAATPSFPSPLAQATTAPLHSDGSSSGSHSSDDEDDGQKKVYSPATRSNPSGTPRLAGDQLPKSRNTSPRTSRSGSPASTQKSLSRPASPTARGQVLTPSALLMKPKRSSSVSLLAGPSTSMQGVSKDMAPRSSSRISPTASPARRFQIVTRTEGISSSPTSPTDRRSSTSSSKPSSQMGSSSPLAIGSPELEPMLYDVPRRRMSHSPSKSLKDANLLGLGWGASSPGPGSMGSWESSSGSNSSPGAGGSKDKGKGRDQSTGPSSPRVSKSERTQAIGIASPPRQRRPSEFLNPSSLDSRKMPVIGGPRTSLGTAHIASLSTSASMISPLNPLPSPWTAQTDASPFSPPASQPSDLPSSTSTSSMGGAIRLNRVPSSVRNAADLIKSSTPSTSISPPSAIPSAASTATVPTPNPSPAGSAPTPSNIPPGRELGNFASLPLHSPRGTATPPLGLDIGKGKPSISYPSTPRNTSPVDERRTSPTQSKTELQRQSSTSTLAPPSSFKAPLPPQPKSKPSLPIETGSSDTFPSVRTHRYRTSMHEGSFKRPTHLSDAPPPWATPENQEPVTSGAGQRKPTPLGLGLNVPSAIKLATSVNTGPGSGSITPGGASQPRVRSTTGKGYEMDLAGIGAMGDAASHASMIMQSRQAKLQRWRPNSAGKASTGDSMLPPAFNRSATTGAPAMLAAPRVGRQAQWGVKDHLPSAASSPGEDLPPFPSALHALGRVESLPLQPSPPARPMDDRSSGSSPLKANAGASRFINPLAAPAESATGMERQMSAGGSIGGIEWVDWYDCYKRYKDAKIRAEAAEAAKTKVHQLGESPREGIASQFASSTNSPTTTADDGKRPSPREIDLTSNFDASSAIALTPTTSRDDFGQDNAFRRRSMSVRSNRSSADPTRSPLQKRNSIFERPRQTSNSSVKSSSSETTGNGGKRKKNLVNKMEGWWNAVKSNFIPEGHLPHQPYRPSNLGVSATQRIPSAPSSRRGSEISPIAAPRAALLAPAPMRRDSSHSLRQVTSHTELRSRPRQYESQQLQEAASIVSSTSADIARLSRESSMEPASYTSRPMGRAPSIVPEEPSMLSSRVPSSLEARRKGGPTNLRLELESNVLTTRPGSRMTTSSSSGGERLFSVPYPGRPNEPSSRASSFGIPQYGPGLTPGLPRWDQTPSPIYPVGTESRDDKEDRPVAPGAEITVASVRRHIKHRLNAAKETCDNTLKKAIEQMTKFAEEQRERQSQAIIEDDQPLDYFDAISDSPLVDAEESEIEGGDAFEEGLRSRHASTSRPPSRRPSISRPFVGASPTKRLAMLPASPSRVRRRPSAVPRSFPGQQRLSRNLSLSLDRTVSASSSRSTSRSRSPMPTSTRGVLLSAAEEALQGDREFLACLQDIIVLATEVMDSSVSALTARSGTCTAIIQKLQKIGSTWDDHDDWPGREWYVDILMAVANLTRVLDWWEAEKGFWNFDDEDENEPILFVMKPGQGKEEPKFDKEFGAALIGDIRRSSPVTQLLQVPEAISPVISLDLPPSDSASNLGTAKPGSNTPIATATDNLRFLADQARSVNIVMELGLQGEDIEYVNDAIMEVVGRDPEDCLNLPITELLAPADASVFAEATSKLLEDDNNTVQLRFRFEVQSGSSVVHPPLAPGPMYIELEGVGMLMREGDKPSHTMWVLKPVTATKANVGDPAETAFPINAFLSNDGILCRICEREIVTWFFEKHNETCDAVHRLEAEINGCNECLHDLQQTVVQLLQEVEDASTENSPQYQGVLFFSLPDSITSGHENTVPAGPQGVEIRKVTQEHLRDVIQILSVAQQVEVPSVQEDEADLPSTVQRYFNVDSEHNLNQVMRWQRPQTFDRALSLLFGHAEEQLRRKQKAIARMQSTIRYSENTRHEWEDKVNQILAERDEGSASESGSDIAEATSGAISPTEPSDLPENSPPGVRKIAPQARLPITQGHPQRPSTAHGESSSMFAASPVPLVPTPPTSAMQPPNSAPLPSQATLPSQPMLEPSPKLAPLSAVAEKKATSPLLVPLDISNHHRRLSTSKAFKDAPLSPRIPPALNTRGNQPSIKDFEILKPISRGAFGSVYLAKKVATGDYFAIKALKKSDMIAKNQITNVKAERTILMNQASSPYVAKLFFSFQSKEYLYLVMEYLNGGDCASLVKTLGGLPEEWARNYTAEVVLGLEYLHSRNIVHRDIKPDNLLIDARGHLKLTDFGLSRIGLLNRQVGGPRPAFLRGTNLRGSARRPANPRGDSGSSADSPILSPEIVPAPPMSQLSQSYFAQAIDTGSADESSGSDSAGIIPRHMRTWSTMTKQSAEVRTPRFVGTPDYLAPESILGIGTDDKAVDWWALGVVLYEFIYGIPPFHADSPEKVFDNVVSRRINWHEDEMDVSPAGHDLMNRLMHSDPLRRLGARGADEVKQHAFFAGIDWSTIASSEASFVPDVTDPESTDYFDSRGAVHAFHDDDAVPLVSKQPGGPTRGVSARAVKQMEAIMDDIASHDNFGEFNFKNVPSLKQANDDVIRKLRTDSMAPIGQTLDGAPLMSRRPRSLSVKMRDRERRKASDSGASQLSSIGGPPSPSTSTSSAASTPSRASNIPPSTPSAVPLLPHPQHFRRPSELNALDRVKSSEDGDIIRRASAPTRIRTGSNSSAISDKSTSMELWRKRRQVSLNSETPAVAAVHHIPPESPESHASLGSSHMGDRALDVLIAEDNPISQKILETLLTRMGCRCICVEDGPQALAATMGSIRFDVIICDIHMPVVSGEQVARMIRSTNNHNQNTPIIAATSYEQHQSITEEGTLFSAVLAKPVLKTDLIKCLGKLGFILSSAGSTSASTNDAMSTGTPV